VIARDSEVVRAAVQRVLARPEFQPEKHPVQEWVARCIETFVDWIRRFFGVSAQTAGDIVAGAIYVALGVLAGFLVVWLARSIRRTLRRGKSDAEQGATATDARALHAAELAKRARDAEARGDHALALRLYFWALVVGLGERGGLEYREAWTNRELLERGAPAPHVDRVLRPLVPELDRKLFGPGGARGPGGADADDVARMEHLFREMVGSRA
jgi:hypothetical protein